MAFVSWLMKDLLTFLLTQTVTVGFALIYRCYNKTRKR